MNIPDLTPAQQATLDRATEKWIAAAKAAAALKAAYQTPGTPAGGEPWFALNRAEAAERKARGTMHRLRTMYLSR